VNAPTAFRWKGIGVASVGNAEKPSALSTGVYGYGMGTAATLENDAAGGAP